MSCNPGELLPYQRTVTWVTSRTAPDSCVTHPAAQRIVNTVAEPDLVCLGQRLYLTRILKPYIGVINVMKKTGWKQE